MYIPLTNHSDRLEFFLLLVTFVSSWDCRDYIIFGDFNAVLRGDEKWGCNGFDSASNDLVVLVEPLGLQDLPLHGSVFTFFSYGSSGARSRLDRFLVSSVVGTWYHNVIQQAVFRFVSDHIPITLSFVQLSPSPKPFRFFNI